MVSYSLLYLSTLSKSLWTNTSDPLYSRTILFYSSLSLSYRPFFDYPSARLFSDYFCASAKLSKICKGFRGGELVVFTGPTGSLLTNIISVWPVYLSVWMSIWLSVCLCACPSICLCFSLPIWLTVCLPVYLPLSLSMCVPMLLSACQFIWLVVCLRVCLQTVTITTYAVWLRMRWSYR